MLGWLVGGTTARTLTSIEHSIVAECLRRLFVGDDGSGALREEPNERPTLHAVQCALDLHGRDGQAATVRLFAEDHGLEATPMAVRQPDLREVGLHVRASLPTVGVHLAEVRCWREGALVTMQRPQSEVAITLALGPKRVAVAQLGCVRGYRAARIIMVGVGRR